MLAVAGGQYVASVGESCIFYFQADCPSLPPSRSSQFSHGSTHTDRFLTLTMADPGQEKDYGRPVDPVADSDIAHQDEPVDVDGEEEEKEYLAINTQKNTSSSDNETKSRMALQQTKSYATTASAVSQTSQPVHEKKPWYKTANPLRWGTPPPIPETRGVSKEHNASFLSMLFFGWIGPMMSVSLNI